LRGRAARRLSRSRSLLDHADAAETDASSDASTASSELARCKADDSPATLHSGSDVENTSSESPCRGDCQSLRLLPPPRRRSSRREKEPIFSQALPLPHSATGLRTARRGAAADTPASPPVSNGGRSASDSTARARSVLPAARIPALPPLLNFRT